MSEKINLLFLDNSDYRTYDPANISVRVEYNFLRMCFSSLIEFDSQGEIVPGVADKFYWRNDELYLHIRKDLKTVDGHIINAFDVEKTFKRLLTLDKNSHGKLKLILCQADKVKKIDDDCKGIRVVNDHLIAFKPNSLIHKNFLLNSFESMDYAIIPRNSLDNDLKITEYRNTSGLYYVDNQDSSTGTIKLKINKNHYHYSDDKPAEINLINSNEKQILSLLRENKIDFIPTYTRVQSKEFYEFKTTKTNEYNFHETSLISLESISFTKRGFNFPLSRRIAIATKIKNAFKQNMSSDPTYHEIDQMFLGEGKLSEEQALILANLYKNADPKEDGAGFVLAVNKNRSDFFINLLKEVLPKLEIRVEDLLNTLKSNDGSNNSAHAFIATLDASYYENLNFLNYTMSANLYDMQANEKEAWIEDYMSKTEKVDRLKMVQDLHFKTLTNFWYAPIHAEPYFAIIRKPWKLDFPIWNSGTPIWNIKKEQ